MKRIYIYMLLFAALIMFSLAWFFSNSPKLQTTEGLASTLMTDHHVENADDAFTIALYLRGIDTIQSEVIDRYRPLIDSVINDNQ